MPDVRTIRRHALRDEAKRLLGGCCVRCGITNPLDFDHVFDDGHLTVRLGKGRSPDLGAKIKMWKAIIDGERSRFQLLCPNCNRLKAIDRDEFDKPPNYGPLVVSTGGSGS